MNKFEPGRTLFETDQQGIHPNIIAQMWEEHSPERRQSWARNEEIIIIAFLQEAIRKAEKFAKDVDVSPPEPTDFNRAIWETIEEYQK